MALPSAYVFSPFRLVPELRSLQTGDAPVKIGSRAFDTLLALVEQRHRVLPKHELMDLVWPHLVVEENNLQVQVMTLRKLLGYGAIATVPGRGYRFVLPVTVEGDSPDPAAAAVAVAQPPQPAATPRRRTNLSPQTSALYGRDDDTAALSRLLRGAGSAPARLVTVAGAGGIGKTRLAQAAAAAVVPDFGDGVWWVELATLADGSGISAVVAQALGLQEGGGADGTAAVLACLEPLHLLLVLDNCEHLLDAVAALVAQLVATAPRVQVMVTSQEVLHAPQEHVYRVGTLSLPAMDDGLAALAASGAGALFAARAAAADRRFVLADANAGAVADICRRLDGIPLAIELAAARLPLLGVDGVRARLNDRFKVLTAGARAVLRRHQTLRAALEWSHALLSPPEQAVFRRLGVFAGGFTLEAAQGVADDEQVDSWEVLEHLGALVDKSLVLADGDVAPRYRMLETTRLYALECLAAAGETDALMRRHAETMVQLLAVYDARRYRTSGDDWLRMTAEVDNVRAAFDWSAQAARGGTPEDLLLALDVASHGAIVFVAAGLTAEGFARLARRRDLVAHGMPDGRVARFWLWLAKMGALAGHAESLDAARRAERLYAALGDDERRYDALHVLISIAALRGQEQGLEQALAEAHAIERSEWPPRLRANLRFAEHRLRQLQGRYEEALACVLEQGRLVVEGGLVAESTVGPSAADCEAALGRLDAAEQRARAALALLDEAPLVRMDAAYALDTLTVVLTLQGRHDEALACGRRARRLLQLRGADFRLLGTLALNAALQGRYGDAALVAGHADTAQPGGGGVPWPAAAARRSRLDALLAAALPPAERQQLQAAGAALTREQAFVRAFGDTAALPAGAAAVS